jgi:hypothetical protein
VLARAQGATCDGGAQAKLTSGGGGTRAKLRSGDGGARAVAAAAGLAAAARVGSKERVCE